MMSCSQKWVHHVSSNLAETADPILCTKDAFKVPLFMALLKDLFPKAESCLASTQDARNISDPFANTAPGKQSPQEDL